MNRLARFSAVLLGVLVASVALVPALAATDPLAIGDVLATRLVPPVSLDALGHFHLLGTDRFGRDLFVRMMLAGRISLTVGVAGSLLAGVVGTVVGAAAAWRGGLADRVAMGVSDALLSIPRLILLLLCAALWWYESAKIRDLDAQIVVAEKRQKELQAIKVQVDALEAKRATFQKKVDLIERLKAEQTGPVHMLDEISKSLPDFVWLTAMDQTGPTVKFTGEATGLTSIADFIAALERSGWFPNVDLSSSQEANNIVTYVLTSTFLNPEVAAKQAAAAAANKPIPGSTAATTAPPAR